jgi:GT2 family glycosyltransferase
LPLRWSGQRVKTAWRAGKRLWQGARHAGRRTNLAMQILRNGGPLALANRIRDRIGAGYSATQASATRFTLAEAIAPLVLASAADPLVSIIIPAYGQHLHTFSCLKSIAENSKGIAFEVIVMDDCSPEPAADALAQVQGVRLVRNPVNLGFLRTCNKGAREARGRYLVFLNNDTLALEGWLDALLRVFEIHPAAGAVGAKLIYPDGSLQEAGGILWRDGSGWNYGRGDDPDKPEYNYLRDVDYCSGACLMVPRALFFDLGSFDEQYAPAYCEDSDFCLAVRKAGRRVLYQPAARVVHFEGVSHGTDVSGGLKAYQEANARKQFAKWQAELATHRINGMAPELERDRGAGRRMLYIDATMVTPDQDSGSLRVSRVLKAARKHRCKVTFIADNLEYLPPYVGEIQEAGIEVQYYPYLKSIEDFLERRGAYYDVIILSRYYVAEKYIDCVRKYAPQALLALDTHDLHFLRLRRLAELDGSASAAQSAERTYAQEMKVMRACDVTLVVSHVERDILAECLPQATVKIFTNIHDVAEEIAPFGNREGLMFVGGYRHPPNVDAVIWYAMEVLPEVKRRLPGVKTYIIGSNPPESITSLADEALEVVGFVPDMTPYLQGCRLSISPLRYGAGVKGKVNQAMSYGLPVVATTPSVEGMHLQDGVEVLVADSPADFAAAIERIYRDEALWTCVSKASRENVRAYFSEDAAWRVMSEMFEMAEQGAARKGKG